MKTILTSYLLQFDFVLVGDPFRRISVTQRAKCDNEHITDAIELTVWGMVEFLPEV